MKPADYMTHAIGIAREKMHARIGGPFGAVIVHQGKIIAEGWNEVTTSLDPTAHAEVVAIRRATQLLGRFDLSGTEIYASCEPCPMCLGAIYWARIDRLYFASNRYEAAEIGFDDDLIYREIALPHGKRQIPTIPMPSDDARTLFREWAEMPDKVPY